MTTIHIAERAAPASRVRLVELDFDAYPDRTLDEWVALVRGFREGPGARPIWDDHNMVMYAGMASVAAVIGRNGSNGPAVWQNGTWYRQALGTSTTAPTANDTALGLEYIRKAMTDNTRNGRVNYTLTLFTPADFASSSTTVLGSPAPTTTVFTVSSITGFRQGDLIRVTLSTGYVYATIQSIAGAQITLASALSVAPPAGTAIDQVMDEAGMFGDLPSQYTTGTATFTNGSAVVTGSGTTWTQNVGAGDQIRLATNGSPFYTIQSVDSDIQVTLTATYAQTTSSAASYLLRGTMFNHVNGLRYVKLPSRGVAIENQWSWGG